MTKTISIFKNLKNKEWKWHLLIPLVLIVFYVAYSVLPDSDVTGIKQFIHNNLFLHTNFHDFSFKPWGLLTFFLFHDNPVLLVINLAGFLVFSSLTSNVLGRKVIIPIYFVGNITAALFLIFFASLPFSKALTIPTITAGSSGGIMALLIVSAFYIPLKIVRFYGIFPVKLKFVGMALPALSIFFLVANKFAELQLQYLGGMLSGMLFAIAIRSGNVNPSNLKPVKKNRNIPVYHQIPEAEKLTNMAITEEEEEEEIVSPSEYVDYLLEKISRNGIDSLSQNEKDYLKSYSQSLNTHDRF